MIQLFYVLNSLKDDRLTQKKLSTMTFAEPMESFQNVCDIFCTKSTNASMKAWLKFLHTQMLIYTDNRRQVSETSFEFLGKVL